MVESCLKPYKIDIYVCVCVCVCVCVLFARKWKLIFLVVKAFNLDGSGYQFKVYRLTQDKGYLFTNHE